MSRGVVVFVSFLGAMLGSHLVIGLCAARLMTNRRRVLRLLVVLLFALLPFVFGMAWSWNRRAPGIGPSLLHIGGSLWLAFAIHFLTAGAIMLPLAAAAAVSGRGLRAGKLIRTAGVLGLALTLLGAVNARFPRVRTVSIPVRDLPAAWENRTVVQLSDVHLGAMYGPRFLERLVRKVNRLDPDLIVITGDLFDVFVTDPGRFAAGLARLRSRQGVYLVTGNHEAHVGLDKVRAALRPTGIVILDGRIVNIEGLQFAGVGDPAAHDGRSLSAQFSAAGGYDRQAPCVLLFHTPTAVDRPPDAPAHRHLSTYFSPRTDFRFVRAAGVDVQLSGHTHAGQTFPFTLVTRRIFGAYAAGLHRRGGFSLYTSAGAGTWGPPIRIGTTPEIAVIRLHRR